MATVEPWTSDRLGDLVALVDAAVPNESLSPDELLAVAWDQPGIVLGAPDGSAAVVVTAAIDDGESIGAIQLVAVHPGSRRQGAGRTLLAEAERWAVADHDAAALRIGSAGSGSLWPGVDVHRMPAMLCLAETAGYRAVGERLNLSVPATFRADPPAGIAIRRVIDAADEQAVLALVRHEFPSWSGPVGRSVEHGSCLAAVDERAEPAAAVGFASHSVDRAGWLGPMGTAAAHRRRGIGAALLGAVARDLTVASRPDVEIVGAEQVRLFVRAGGAVSRVFRTFRRELRRRA